MWARSEDRSSIASGDRAMFMLQNDRLRPVLFASFSSRFLTPVSTRTVNVEGMGNRARDGLCTYCHKVRSLQLTSGG